MRRAAPQTMLAFGAAFAGAIGIVSALTPEIAARSDVVQGVLPSGVTSAARVLALSLGIALVWLSRSLARGRHRAWQLAVGLVLASAATHLAKGLDFEESAVSLVLLVALWRWRSFFRAPGEPAALRPLVRVLAALGVVAVLRAVANMREYDRIQDALTVIAFALAFNALYFWLRPLAGRVRQSARDRTAAERIVSEHGRDSLAFFALRRDKSWFFSPSGSSFLAYRVVNGTALVAGEPIGDAAELPELLAEFRRVAASRGWRTGLLNVGAARLPLTRSLGFHSIYFGDEAIVRPESFSLEGRAIRKVRQAVARIERTGYRIRMLPSHEAGPELQAELARVSEEWRGRWPDRGFCMAMDSYEEGMIAVAEGPDGSVGGFVHLVPSPASGGYSLGAMRRRRDTPNGLMEALVVETIAWAKRNDVPELSLNFSVFGDVLRSRGPAPGPKRLLRFTLLRLDRFFQLERLNSFSAKFYPEWRPRYICFERWTDLPLVCLAYLHVESLLTPPGPWVRSTAG